MGKSSKDAYGAESAGNLLNFNPSNLIIVGLDEDPTDDTRDLLDDESRLQEPSAELVASVKMHGVRAPIHVRKIKGCEGTYVVNGRQRVKAARLANEQLRKEKSDLQHLVPGVVDQVPTASDSFVTMVIANEHQLVDGPLVKARKAQRAREAGRSDDEIAAMFGVSKQSLRQWTALLSCTPEILRTVEAGKLSASTATEIGKLPASEQKAALATALETGGGKDGGRTRDAIKAQKNAKASGEKDTSNASEFLPWRAKDIEEFAAYIDPAQNDPEEHGEPSEVQRAVYNTLRMLLGKVSFRALSEFCPHPEDGRGQLGRWAKECAPKPKRTAEEKKAGKK